MSIRQLTSAVCAVALFVAAVAAPVQVLAAANQIDGTIYWDQNNNGVQDTGEPGVPNVLVSFGYGSGQKTDLTDSNGNYAITGTSGTSRVTVHSGWLRSSCDSLNCSVGTAGGNDFTVNNQHITLGSVNGTAGATLNTGLVPDWGGTYPIPSSPTTATTDIAARLTYHSGCSTTAERTCVANDRVKLFATFFNQGTGTITDPTFVVELPVGHEIDDVDSWINPQDVFTITHPSTTSVSILEGFSATKGYGVYRLNGTIPAGANSAVQLYVDVTSSAIDTATPYPTSDPFDKQPHLRVISIDETGDRDSSFCETNGSDWRMGSCEIDRLGVHDKTKTFDHTDGAGWNISGSSPVTRTFDVALQTQLASGQTSQVAADSLVDYRLRVTNQSTGDSGLRNIKLVGYVPSGLTFSTSDNPGWVLESGQPVTYISAQILPGQAVDVPLKLRTTATVTSADNGTAALRVAAELAHIERVTAGGSGTFHTATDADSTLDTNSANDGTAINDEITGSLSGSPADEDDADYEDITITTIAPPDTTAPSVPTGLSATAASPSQVNLSWNAATDNVGVTGYNVYRNGVVVGTASGTTYSDTNLSQGTAYSYTVTALDAATNESSQSTGASTTTHSEFVLNKSVETNLTGWSDLWNPAYTSLSRPSGTAHDGNYAIRVDSSSATSVTGGFTNYANSTRWLTNAAGGKTYTASAWVKASIAGMRICVRQTEYSGSTNVGNTETCATYNDTDWHQLTNTKTALTNGNSMTVSVYSSNIKSDRHFLADSFSLTAPN